MCHALVLHFSQASDHCGCCRSHLLCSYLNSPTGQLHTLWICPPLPSFDMHVRPTLAVNMLTAALVGELSCCGRIWASCSGCLSEVCTVTLVIFHCWWYSRTCGAHRQSN